MHIQSSFIPWNMYYLVDHIVLLMLTGGICCESELYEYMQPDDITSGRYDSPKNLADHICTRPCVHGDYKICYYRFVFEPYMTMNGFCGNCPNVTSDCHAKSCVAADGFERVIYCINRRMPGPSIQVCRGDMIIVDVKNMMTGRSTTVHWHGVKQIKHKYMDGVPMVTQCPILEHEIFRYHFRANDAGTHFYHSHGGTQKVDGIVGSLIVRRELSDDPNADQYDYDLPSHVIVVQDWRHDPGDDLYPGIQKRPNKSQIAETYLIQGKGTYINGSMPLAEFNVTKGCRYQFRIVAGTCYDCQFCITIEKHYFIITGADGQPTKPYKVDSLTLSPGERITAVIECNQKVDAYWMSVRAVGFCAGTRAFQLAILRYKGHSGNPSTPRPGYDLTEANKPGKTLNPFNSNCTEKELEKDGPCIQDLRSAYATPENILGKHNHRIIWAFGFFIFQNNKPYTNTSQYPKYLGVPGVSVGSTVNGIVNDYPPCPLLSQWSDVPKSVYCPENDGFYSDRWNVEHRQCLNVIKIPLHRVIEILVCDAKPFGMSHAIHLHGYDMYILEQGVMPEAKNFNESLTILLDYLDSKKRKKFPTHVVNKDTVPLTSGGWFTARIYTDNAGYWFFHCHFAYHLESGMSGVLKIGKHDEMPPPPKHFPKCGDYLPTKEDCVERDEY